MATSLSLGLTTTFNEVIATNVPAISSSGNSVTHNGMNLSSTLTSTSTPVITTGAIFNKTMSSGAGTIDLTSLTGTNGAAVDLSGLKVQVLHFKNPSAANISVTKGASNGYGLGTGGTSFTIVIPPGGQCVWYASEGTPDVGSGAKTLDISGTGSQYLTVGVFAG